MSAPATDPEQDEEIRGFHLLRWDDIRPELRRVLEQQLRRIEAKRQRRRGARRIH